MQVSLKVLAAVSVLLLSIPLCRAQGYLTTVGVPTFTTAIPTENGYINAGNGDLRLTFPLGTFPERGGRTFSAALIYDSRIWVPVSNTWFPGNGGNLAPGWFFVTNADTGAVSYSAIQQFCDDPRLGTYTVYNLFTWMGSDGTQRQFPVGTASDPNNCANADAPTGSANAGDSSGFLMNVTYDCVNCDLISSCDSSV